MPQDDSLEVYWDDLALRPAANADLEVSASTLSNLVPPGTFVLGTSRQRILVMVHGDGSIEYGPDYTPDEAAVILWEAIGRRRLEMEDRLLLIDHMESVLAQLGEADLANEQARLTLLDRQSNVNLMSAQTTQNRLERAMSRAIELGRGMARREVPIPPTPAVIPRSIRENPNSSYGSDPSEPGDDSGSGAAP